MLVDFSLSLVLILYERRRLAAIVYVEEEEIITGPEAAVHNRRIFIVA